MQHFASDVAFQAAQDRSVVLDGMVSVGQVERSDPSESAVGVAVLATDEPAALIAGQRAALDCRTTRHAQRPQPFGGLRSTRSVARLHGVSGGFGGNGVRLASPTAQLSVWTVHLRDLDTDSAQIAGEVGSLAAFDSDFPRHSKAKQPSKQLPVTDGGRREVGDVKDLGPTVDHRCHVNVFVGVDPARDNTNVVWHTERRPHASPAGSQPAGHLLPRYQSSFASGNTAR